MSQEDVRLQEKRERNIFTGFDGNILKDCVQSWSWCSRLARATCRSKSSRGLDAPSNRRTTTWREARKTTTRRRCWTDLLRKCETLHSGNVWSDSSVFWTHPRFQWYMPGSSNIQWNRTWVVGLREMLKRRRPSTFHIRQLPYKSRDLVCTQWWRRRKLPQTNPATQQSKQAILTV